MSVPRLAAALLGDASTHTMRPERAVQFGTGAFLRGFVDFFLDAANERGQFEGRVVAISTTGSGRDRAFAEQDGLFTVVARGIENGHAQEEIRVVRSVSRALSASDEWDAVLACARNPQLALVFSNTTEVGIRLAADDAPDASPPRSFPAKLTRFLYERARTFAFASSKGVVVIPCELIEHNGAVLRGLVLELAARWDLEPGFARWIHSSVTFCDTLVDRIVPGAPASDDAAALTTQLGYRDDLLTTAELFRQFVIQGDDALRARIGFVDADPGIAVVDDVAPYRERKVRLLNGAHTAAVSVALLAGCSTVCEAMNHALVRAFVRRVVLDEILPVVEAPDAERFARSVLERFENPHIHHALADISMQGTAKWRVRLIPSVMSYAASTGRSPDALALGFAAHLAYLHPDTVATRRAAGLVVREDDAGAAISAQWAGVRVSHEELHAFVSRVAADRDYWGANLAELDGFDAVVAHHLQTILTAGVDRALESLMSEPVS